MGVLGELFPGPKITDEAGESGTGEPFRLGPIDLENGVLTVRRAPGVETQPSVGEAPVPDAGE